MQCKIIAFIFQDILTFGCNFYLLIQDYSLSLGGFRNSSVKCCRFFG